MTNFEKYKKDIEEAGYRFGYNIKTNEITKCNLMNCHDCEFNSLNNCDCRQRQVKWLYKEHMVLTDAEINLINTFSEMTGQTYNFITRDRSNVITLYPNIPIIHNDEHGRYYSSQNDCINILETKTKKLFQNIRRKDGIYDITDECFIEE